MEFGSQTKMVMCGICRHQYVPAKSKRVNACPNCVHIEKHGESIKDAMRRKQAEQQEKWRKKAAERERSKPRTKIPAMSAKGRKKAVAVAEMKRELKEDAAEGAFVECRGCYMYFKGIDASHKVPLSQSIALSAEAKNVTLLCRDCHNKWEHGTVMEMIELKCFVDDMHYLFDMDPERFWKIFHRCLDEFERAGNKKLGRIIALLEAFEADDYESGTDL